MKKNQFPLLSADQLMKAKCGGGDMGLTMGLNLLLLMAMVASNLLSLYHLSSTIQFSNSSSSPPPPLLPHHLIHHLQNIRVAIYHLNLLHPHFSREYSTQPRSTLNSDLFLHYQLSPVASGCHGYPQLLQRFMNYTPFSFCPFDSDLAEALILRGCHPLPRRRCFARTPVKPSNSLPLNPFSSNLPDSNIIWSQYKCKNLSCLNLLKSNVGFDPPLEVTRFMTSESGLDLTIPRLLQIAKSEKSALRIGIDIGGGTGTFAARMKLYNVTIVTTTMNIGAPFNEVTSLRGLIPLHVPLQQRLPVFDGVMDVVRCGHAVNRWIPEMAMEFLFFDVDRVLRGGGFLWLDHFSCKGVDLDKIYFPLIGKLKYKKVKWVAESKPDSGRLKNGEVYLTALLQKPVST